MDSSFDNNNRKEDILAKSRKAKKDEGIEYAIDQGAKKGNYYAIEIIGSLLFFLSLVSGQMLVVYALAAIILASWFGEFITKYQVLTQKRYLIAAIVFGLSGIFVVILFVKYLGILQGWWN